MDKIAQDLRLLEQKQEELKNDVDSNQSLLQSIFKQLEEYGKEILSKEKQLKAKEIQFSEEYELRIKQLYGIEKLSGELSEELVAKKQQVESLNSLIQKNSKELEVKEKQYIAIQNSIKEKERKYDCIQKSISRETEKLVILEKTIQLKLQESQEMWKKFEDVTELKESRLNEMQRSLEKCMKGLDLKTEQLKLQQESVSECEQKIRLEQEKLSSIQNSVVKFSNELESKKKQLDYVRKLKDNNCASLKKSARDFEMKKKEIESFVELKEEVLESKLEDLDLIEQKVNECLKEVEEKARNLCSLQRMIEEHFHRLELKEREFERRVNEFKLSQQEFESTRKSATNILHSVVKIEQREQTHTSASKLLPAICSVDKASDVVESIHNLIERGEIIHAVKHICKLKLTDKFSPETLLVEYLEDAKNSTSIICKGRRSNEAKKKARDKEVAILKAVKECIKDCNLHSGFSILYHRVRPRLVELENKIQSIFPAVEQFRKRRNDNAAAPQGRPQIKIKYSGKTGME